jgi:hypothetical protein
MYYRGENNEIIEAYGAKDVDPSKPDCTTTPTWIIILLIIILIMVIAFVIYSLVKNNKKLY